MENYNCKKNSTRPRLLQVLRTFGFFALIVLVAAGGEKTTAQASQSAAAAKKPGSAIASKCVEDLAKRLKLQAEDIEVAEVQPTVWPDTALGMPEIGKMYAQVLTTGWKVFLEARGSRYLYTTSTKAYRYGGPVSIWSDSMLYTQPVQDEPNLNGDLYQCSLLGTNSIRVFSGVTDYYPQNNGLIIIKRRTSRSAHELWLIKVGEAAKAKILHEAFDLGEAAINSNQDEWAGFVRPSLGTEWDVVVARVADSGGNAKTIPLPDGVRPGQIAWSGETLMILVKKGEQTICFETSPKADAPEWKAAGTHIFPGLRPLMLNKSEWLEVTTVTQNGKPGAEVARVWFTGDRNVIARISDFTLRGYDLHGSSCAFVWGEEGSKTTAYAINISTGEVILSFRGSGQNVKLFLYPPHNGPIAPAKSESTK